MASGIDGLPSAIARSISVPHGPAARRDAQRPEADAISSGGATRAAWPAQEKGSGNTRLQEAAQASKETLASVLEHAQRASLANDTTIYYQRDETNGRMYLHVKDKRTGEELYRIPKDYLPAPDKSPAESHTVDLII
jgi:uncharacterized FlaG/YvyC family protein